VAFGLGGVVAAGGLAGGVVAAGGLAGGVVAAGGLAGGVVAAGGLAGGVVVDVGALPVGGIVTVLPTATMTSFIFLLPWTVRSTVPALSVSACKVLFLGSNKIRLPSVNVPCITEPSEVFNRVNASP
jgi:hypothetical protein